MTGYEIYDEGYEAGYESAMEDLMEAMEGSPYNRKDATKAGVLYSKLNSQRNEAREKGDFKKANRIYKRMQAIDDKYDKWLPDPKRRDVTVNHFISHYVDNPDTPTNINVRKTTQKIIDENGGGSYDPYKVKVRKKKANEALFDFDDIDHAYLDDEYDDFDYE